MLDMSYQIEPYQKVIVQLQEKYGMTYDQFEARLAARSAELVKTPSPALNQVVIAEEEDAFDWKVACDVLTQLLEKRN